MRNPKLKLTLKLCRQSKTHSVMFQAIMMNHVMKYCKADHEIYPYQKSSIQRGGSGAACTKNIPHLHALGPQFCMYENHDRPTYTITPILHVRKKCFSYTHSRGNFACTRLAYTLQRGL